MEHYKKVRRLGSLLLAAVVAILTLSVMVHATQVITTPNAASASYSLAAGANSSAITPPLTRRSCLWPTRSEELSTTLAPAF
jgi:hypothetical protein